MTDNDKRDLNNGDLSADELLRLLKANLSEDNLGNAAQKNPDEILNTESESTAEEIAFEESTPESKPKKYKFTKKIVKVSNFDEETAAEETKPEEDTYAEQTKIIDALNKSEPESEIGETKEFAKLFDEIRASEGEESEKKAEEETPVEDESAEIAESAESTEEAQTAYDDASNYKEAIAENSPDEERAPLDSTDINLMMALGLEDELEQTVGIDKITEIAASNEYMTSAETKTELVTQNDKFKDEEYENYEQTQAVADNYKNLLSKIKLRLIGSAAFALCIFIFENLHLIGANLPGIFNYAEYPGAHTFLSLQLLLLCAALSYKELYAGIKNIIAFDFSSYSIAALAVVFTGICDLIIGFFGNGTGLNLYNFAAAVYLVLCVAGEYFTVKRETYNFEVISANKPKYAVLISEGKKTSNTNFLSEEVVTDLNVTRADFIGGFFKRTRARSKDNTAVSYVSVAALAAAVLFAIISYTNTKNINIGVAVANLTALMCLPASMFASYALPPFIATKKALSTKSTIIGDTASDEYSDAASVIFDDKDVFPSRSVKIKSVKVYDNIRIDTVLSDLSSIFAKLGGPVGEVLAHATAEIEHSDNVKISEVTELGVSAEVDENPRILVGKTEYMANYNIVPEYDYEDEIQLAGGNVRIMYVAYGEKISAKLYIQYSVESGFEKIVRQLDKYGMKVIIKTFDPNIDNRLLSFSNSKVTAKIERYDISVVDEPKREKTYSGIVSLSSIKAVTKTILLCGKLNHVKTTANVIKYMSVIVSFIIMLIFTLSNSSSILLSMFVAIYHLFWVLPVFIISKIYLN